MINNSIVKMKKTPWNRSCNTPTSENLFCRIKEFYVPYSLNKKLKGYYKRYKKRVYAMMRADVFRPELLIRYYVIKLVIS